MNLINQIKTIFYSNKIYQIEAADLKRSGGLDFKLAGANNAEIQNVELILPQLQYYVGVNPIMHLPTNMLVMPGGHAFSNPNHPFLKTLKEGHHSLFQYYSKLAPNNIAQLYGLEEKVSWVKVLRLGRYRGFYVNVKNHEERLGWHQNMGFLISRS